jgi:hypothetical protein
MEKSLFFHRCLNATLKYKSMTKVYIRHANSMPDI